MLILYYFSLPCSTSSPSITQLIQASEIKRVVIGCPNPIPEQNSKGAAILHSSGIEVIMGVLKDECTLLILEYTRMINSKLQTMARKHFAKVGRPLGFLHCSVVKSDDIAAFARNGNAFGKDFGGKTELSFRDVCHVYFSLLIYDCRLRFCFESLLFMFLLFYCYTILIPQFGSFELAPPPESIWAVSDDSSLDNSIDSNTDFFMDFEDEEEQEMNNLNPMMPSIFYEQVDAVIATFPKCGNGPIEDQSIRARLNGLKWLATHGNSLPFNVERILILDATDLFDLPLHNNDPNLPAGVDVEKFWKGEGRKATRILLRHGDNALGLGFAEAAEKAAQAARLAKEGEFVLR